jgi:ssDNA-binding Zn-finger/Zn-ribbon topoisomerase 1
MTRYAKPILLEGQSCPYCATGTIVKRTGCYGDFMACDNYPRCAAVGRISPSVNQADFATQEWLLKNNKRIDPVL